MDPGSGPGVGKSEAVPCGFGWAVHPAISASFPSVGSKPWTLCPFLPRARVGCQREQSDSRRGVLRCAFELLLFAGLGVRSGCRGGKISRKVLDCSRRWQAILEGNPRLL